jgi:hypothetical protein
MPSDYHNSIQDEIEKFGKTQKKVKRVRTSGKYIHICHPTKNKSIPYNPDVHFELKNRKIIVFEILDSQSMQKTIADVTRSFLSPNVAQVYFIVKTEKMRDEVITLCDVLLSKLADDFRTKKNKLPMEANVIWISNKDVKNNKKLGEILEENISI